MQCAACGHVLYKNSKPCVGGLILRGENPATEILLTRRAFEPYAGTWDLPGGFLENGEDPEDGLKRELREELGIPIKIEALFKILVDTYDSADVYTLNLFYFVKPLAKIKKVADDVADFAFFPIRKPPKQIVFRCVKEVLAGLRSRMR